MTDKELPTVNWPTQEDFFRIIQLEIDGKPIVRFGDALIEAHSSILDRFLTDQGIEFEKVERQGNIVPILYGDKYQVRGAGFARVVPDNKKAMFYGESLFYGIGIASKHLDLIRKLEPDWIINLGE